MPKLLLDLDKTSICLQGELECIDQSHTLSLPIKVRLGQQSVEIYIINPVELTALIELAYTQYDGVILFTSGDWDNDVRNALAKALNLSDSVRKQFKACSIHSAASDAEQLNLEHDKVRDMTKFERLKKIRQIDPTLKDVNFAFLDNDLAHVTSFKKCPYVEEVLATTYEPEKSFYSETHAALERCKQQEELHRNALTDPQAHYNDLLSQLRAGFALFEKNKIKVQDKTPVCTEQKGFSA